MFCFIEVDIREMALLFRSVRLDVGRPIILEDLVVMHGSWTDSMLKKHVEQKNGLDHALVQEEEEIGATLLVCG